MTLLKEGFAFVFCDRFGFMYEFNRYTDKQVFLSINPYFINSEGAVLKELCPPPQLTQELLITI